MGLAGLVALLTAARIAVSAASGLNLSGDEAQYWSWAQTLDWGYFSKVPMVAYLIAAATAACGDGEDCVRLPSALLHGATALVLFFVARHENGHAPGLMYRRPTPAYRPSACPANWSPPMSPCYSFGRWRRWFLRLVAGAGACRRTIAARGSRWAWASGQIRDGLFLRRGRRASRACLAADARGGAFTWKVKAAVAGAGHRRIAHRPQYPVESDPCVHHRRPGANHNLGATSFRRSGHFALPGLRGRADGRFRGQSCSSS